MKECPVCHKPDVEKNAEICPRCGWEFKIFLSMTQEDETEYKAKLEKAREAYQAKTSKEVRPKEVEVDPRLSENLPYYDFILIGHSSVGKTTYLAMLCEQGGDDNSTWNFRNGGSASDLGDNAPKSISERVKKNDKTLNKSINNISKGTTRYINYIRTEINRQEGYYSTAKDNKLVFSFRPTDAKCEHTLLTLDYPGEWISIESKNDDALAYQNKIKQFANYLNASQSLIIMIDPLIFISGDFQEKDFHREGLSQVQETLKGSTTDERPSEFVPVGQMPVALIINKYDLLKRACENGQITDKEFNDPKTFLEGKCQSVVNSLNNFTNNWKPFFVSCYGMDQPLEKLNEQGAYTPPANPKPFGLEEPLNWLYQKTQRRVLKDTLLEISDTLLKGSKVVARFVLLPLGIIVAIYYSLYASLYAWDSSTFTSIEAKEPAFSEKPQLLYRDYTDSSHWFSSWTGFEEKFYEKRQHFAKLYLTNQLAGPLKHGASVEDFKATIGQVRKWSLDLEDKAFAEEIESIIARELMPLYEVAYGNALREQQDQEQFKTGFREFVALFKNSPYINTLVEKDNNIWALEQYKTIYQVAVNSNQTGAIDVDKLLQLCREYLNTHKKHSHTYGRSVQALIGFIENDLARVKKGGLYPRTFTVGYRGHTLTDTMYGHHKVDVKVPIQVPYTYIDRSGWTDKERTGYRTEYKTEQKEVRTDPKVAISVAINGVEQYTLDTTRRHTDNFSIDWMPGMTVQVVVNNKTGKTTKTENSGFLAINLLKGELNVNGLATVKFTGSDLTIPEMQAPSEKLYAQPPLEPSTTAETARVQQPPIRPVQRSTPGTTVGQTTPIKPPVSPKQNPVKFVRAYYEDINRGYVDSAIRKWKTPKEERLRALIKDSDWVRINKIRQVTHNSYNATVSLDVSGKQKSNATENRWKGTIELENIEGDWKIAKLRLRNQAVIYSKTNTVHLGDEEISSKRWKPLHGECFTARFDVNRQVQKLTLKVDILGSESPLNAIFLNGTKVAVLPYQERRTRRWITDTVVLPTNELRSNRNQLKICSGRIEGGDKDDLQIRKLKLIAD